MLEAQSCTSRPRNPCQIIESVHEAVGGAIVGTCLTFETREYQILPRAGNRFQKIFPSF